MSKFVAIITVESADTEAVVFAEAFAWSANA